MPNARDRHTSPAGQSWSLAQSTDLPEMHAPCCRSHRRMHPPEPHVPHVPPISSQPKEIVGVVVEVVVVAVEVVVVMVGQLGPLPGAGQASQQLVQVPGVPCFAVQCAVSFLTLHLVPVAVVIQQVTAPAGFPQIERAAHLFTTPRQLGF